ncbi:MAG: chloride channel protein [Clostridia bacterium]|nr:chloride channel protein [Clostridia bacterium]
MNRIIKDSKRLLTVVKWLTVSITLGAVCGLLGGLFGIAISFVTKTRIDNSWLIYLLPLAGVATVGIYKLLGVETLGTNQIFDMSRTGKKVSFWLAPAVFVCSVLSHLFGASVGKEGAALQLGGSVSGMVGSLFRIGEQEQKTLTICGMAALFSAAFGTPIGACVFSLEVLTIGSYSFRAFAPALLSSVTAHITATAIGAHGESFAISVVPSVSLLNILIVVLLGIVGGIISAVFCYFLRKGSAMAQKLIPNSYVRVFCGGAFIAIAVALMGKYDYNGSGIGVIENIFHGHTVGMEALIFKLIFTVICVSVGYKGGEIVPTLFMGAALGCALSLALGFPVAFGAAIGMVAMFCGATNCPLATIVIAVELFGGQGFVFFGVAIAAASVASGKISLYHSQRFSREAL